MPLPFAISAGRVQGIALEFGEGRVVVLGEAAMLTASDGADRAGGLDKAGVDNRHLALNVLRWLAAAEALPPLTGLLGQFLGDWLLRPRNSFRVRPS